MANLSYKIGEISAQRRATIVSTSAAALLTLVKLFVGLMSGSVAVLASAIDSILDMGVSLFNFFAIKKAEEHPNEMFPYGKGKVQAIAGVIEGTIITLSGLFIIYEAIRKVLHHQSTEYLGASLGIMLFSILVTWLLVRYLLRIAKETDNIVIKADALHYQTDLLSNGAVVAALLIVWLTGWDWVDALFGLGIGLYIIYSAYEIIEEGVMILLDRSLPSEIVAKIGEIIGNHPKVNGYHWLKTRTDGSHNFVEFHLVLTPEMTLEEAHRIAEDLECKIASLEPNKGWVITPHFDPYDDEHLNEIYYEGKIRYACAQEDSGGGN
ncbi:cation diffusion facilitator family transporter [Nitratifractor sp.]|uniref:cation diffusion facilitator family transporter n=1 Tax=Nitratifractor sp. TaxID=2268144 RepID=UPI0025CFC6DE|nr:cation diffusion facilitator family transporter [Nitratifractor sp.]